jgi:signal peptidase I
MDTSPELPIEPTPALDFAGRPDARGRGAQQLTGFVHRHGGWIAMAVAAACGVGAMSYLQTWPPLAIVQSASMAPSIRTGDVVVLKRLAGPPRVGEVVAITVPDFARSRYGYPPEVTHRVVRIAADGDLTTKGDALKSVDPFTTRHGTVTTEVVATIPAVGRALAFLTSTLGLIWLAGGALLLIILPQLERRRELEKHEHESMTALHVKLEALSTEVTRLHGEAIGDQSSRERLEQRMAAVIEEGDRVKQRLADTIAALQEHHQQTREELLCAIEVAARQQPLESPTGPISAQISPAAPATPAVRRRRSGGLLSSIGRHARKPRAPVPVDLALSRNRDHQR